MSEIKDMFFKLYRGKGAEASVPSDAAGSCASPKGSSSGAGPSTTSTKLSSELIL